MAEVSSTRLYLGNLPRDVTKEDIQNHFKEAAGTIAEVKLMNGFGFIEYEDALDARDVVPTYREWSNAATCQMLFAKTPKDGSDLNGSRLTVQFARGSRQRDFPGPPERPHPRPRRTAHRMQITGLPAETSWQDLKDFARRSGLDVVYSEVGRDRDGKGFVEFETAADLKVAVEKLDTNDFKVPHLVTTTTMAATSVVTTDLHLLCAPVVVHLLRIATHLHVVAMSAIPMPLRRLDVPTKILMRQTGMVGRGNEAHLQGVMADTKSAHVIGDCSSPTLIVDLLRFLRGPITDERGLNGAYYLRKSIPLQRFNYKANKHGDSRNA
ncbi:MAG: hypothetical protein LQ343_003509 [Gyalolechia ehrenbergii]|nr:MAG: hypothetical protein LQ343_003509 [Gyalolechia ehrenbergii]